MHTYVYVCVCVRTRVCTYIHVRIYVCVYYVPSTVCIGKQLILTVFTAQVNIIVMLIYSYGQGTRQCENGQIHGLSACGELNKISSREERVWEVAGKPYLE